MRYIIAFIILLAIALFAGSILSDPPIKRDYQIEATEQGSVIYDGKRLVGVIPFDSTSALTKLIIKDNQ